MIGMADLTKKIDEGLNVIATNNKLPFVFSICSEGGDYVPPKRMGNDVTVYINGITRLTDATTVPTQGTIVAMQTVKLDISYPLADDIPIAECIDPVRSVLNEYFVQTKLQAFPNENGEFFAVASYSEVPTTGNIIMTTGTGLTITFSCNIYYNFIENGVNSFDITMTFDGVAVPYMDATITRVPVTESVPYSDSGGVAKAITNATALNIEFSAPTLASKDNALFAAYKSFLMTGKNSVLHNLVVTYEGETHAYNVVFGQSAMSLEGIKNGNARITLLEAVGI